MNLIFDFDGTIVDSFECIVNKFNDLSDEFNFCKLNREEIQGLRDLAPRELLKRLGIPLYKMPSIIFRVRSLLRKEIRHLKPVPGFIGVLNKLYQKGFLLGMLTSNSKENVITWLHKNNLNPIFDFVCDESTYFTKHIALKKIIKNFNIKKEETFYIGDETRDVKAAHQNKIYSIAVTWGFNSEDALKRFKPHYIVRSPSEILTIF